jgi:tetratricopeptide (TPR) repeat protein
MPAPVTFVASGVRREGASRGGTGIPVAGIGRVKQSVLLTSTRAAQEPDVRMEAVPGQDALVIHVAGGPALWLHPEHARELLLAQQDPASARSATDGDVRDGEIRIPSRLQWKLEEGVPARGAARGFLGDVLVEAIDVITGLAVDKAADFAASKVVEHFDSRVDQGVYRLKPERLTPLKGEPNGAFAASRGHSLVLVHGTFSETSGTFGKLWSEHPQLVRSLFKAYEGRVYGLDHPTLGASPIANAIALAKAVPAGTRLHLLTHSRGGLVAEVLARAAAKPTDPFAPFKTKGYADQHRELRSLADIVSRKGIKVDRVVRVACPARGTLLASKRLDAYVSVVKWGLELAGVPVVPQLVDFLGEVARRRADPESLPGLAAQIPDSPLVQWLHTTDAPITGDLRVVAGDLQGDSVITWIKTLLSDAFYWTDNDLVVQTRSMYGGTPRVNDSTFVLTQSGKVSHFNYFSNSETATAVVDALVRDRPDGFRVIGPLSWGGTSSIGVRAAVVPRAPAAAASLPAVFVLPGILGSNLKVGKDRIWLGWRLVNGFARLAYDAGKKNAVEPDGPIGSFYDDITAYLSQDHEVIPFAFDWRRPIEESANLLANAVEAALLARRKSGKPVRMLAHSMGGLVARTMQLQRRDTWDRMMKVQGARILMLGTPNDGSWAPMQVLTGDDTFGNMVTVVGAPFRSHETRQLIAQFPGLLQLQAGLLDDLGKQERWKALAEEDIAAFRANSVWHRLPLQLDQFRWGIPSQKALDRAVSLRRDLDKQRDKDLGAFAQNLKLVVGRAAFTPSGYELGPGGVAYLDVPDQGDGRVTLQSALLPGVETWTFNADHGALPRRKEAFEAYRELLNDGKTARLAKLSAPAIARGGVASTPVRSRPARALLVSAPPQRESEVLASSSRSAPGASSAAAGAALQVTVVNGDLTYVAEPLLIGHYGSSKLTGAEAVMNRAIGDAMSASLERGLYPSAAGTHQIFVNRRQNLENPWQLPRPAAVIVAGLGAEGELRGSDLVETVRQAVVAWAQRLTEQPATPALLSLATTLLGSGGSGISAGQAAQLIAQGVREANDQLSVERSERQRWPRVGHLQIIELYLDRASEAWRALQTLATASPALYSLSPVIAETIGARRRPPDAGYRGAEYDFISALIQKGEDQEERIVYTIDTKRARSEVRAQATQVPLIRNLVSTASKSTNTDTQIGRTLFSLLVPVDLEPFMGSSVATVIQLDTGTAAIPWELLDNQVRGSGDDRPWAIRTKLLRKLRTGGASVGVHDASADDSVLVIGDPACDRNLYPRLFGAREEAAAVAECIGSRQPTEEAGRRKAASRVTALISPPDYDGVEPDANAVMNATMAGPWRIIHIAGHGAEPVAVGSRVDPRGVVLSDKTFLGPREIGALRVIPELVFVNCCHLASGDVTQLLTETNYDRAKFASGVAEALIKAGVRCVVAAGWAVDDEAARVFATTFYARLLDGSTFIDAVAAAREDARGCGGNTWAAYQCYGDPDWKYRRETGDAQRPTPPDPSQELAGIASAAALVLTLKTLAVKSEYEGADATEQAERLRFLEETYAGYWRHSGEVAEAFGNAWSRAGRFDEAIDWYTRARVAPDGTSSLAAVEQLANLKVRRAWEQAAQTDAKDNAARERARQEIAEAMALLDMLLAVGPTSERESLYGSAYKRLALIEAAAGSGRDAQEIEAISKMKAHYAAAEKIARLREADEPPGDVNAFYPAMNWIAAQLALEGGLQGVAAPDAETLAAVRRSMMAAPPDFWSVVGQTELNMYAALFAGALEENLESLTEEFKAHHGRVSAPKRWATIHDNATFVLKKYKQRATPREVAAAEVLLETLSELAGQRRMPAKQPGTRQRATTPRKRRSSSSRRTRPAKRRPTPSIS